MTALRFAIAWAKLAKINSEISETALCAMIMSNGFVLILVGPQMQMLFPLAVILCWAFLDQALQSSYDVLASNWGRANNSFSIKRGGYNEVTSAS